jgi:signal transduction histidine kinase
MSLSLPDAAAGSRLPEPADLASLARIMHELRTPLMAMGMTAELLSEDLDHLARPEVRQLVATLHRNTVWLHQLVENLHAFTAPGRGPGAQACAPVDLREVLHEIECVIGPVLAAKGQRLEVVAPAALPPVRAARRPLGQVYLNLLGNASKFAPRDTGIRVVLSHTEDGVRVAVEDCGPGFPASAAAQLFDPFYQAATPTAPQDRGLGLGLAIVKDLIEAHGGRVGAENRRGGGARFWFALPLRQKSDAAPVSGLELG